MCILPLQLFEILVLEFSPFPNKPEMGKKKKKPNQIADNNVSSNYTMLHILQDRHSAHF